MDLISGQQMNSVLVKASPASASAPGFESRMVKKQKVSGRNGWSTAVSKFRVFGFGWEFVHLPRGVVDLILRNNSITTEQPKTERNSGASALEKHE